MLYGITISAVSAQTTLYDESFTNYADGTTSAAKWSITIPCKLGKKSKYFKVLSKQMEAMDTKCEVVWTSATIPINAFSNNSVSLNLYSSPKLKNKDYIKVSYKIDGGAEKLFDTNGHLTGNFGTAIASQSGLSGTNLQVIVRIKVKGGKKYMRFDDILVEGSMGGPVSTIYTLNATKPTCAYSQNGSLTVAPLQGSLLGATYQWSTGQTTASISGLSTGTFSVTITQNGKQEVLSTILTPTSQTTLTATATNTLMGTSNGAVSLSVFGGVAPYSYSWSNGASTQNISGLAANTYNVTVTGASGCTATTSAIVAATPAPCICIGSGSWTNPAIWSGTCSGGNGKYAGALDSIEIKGYTVTVDSAHTVKALVLREGSSDTKLLFTNSNTLTVLEDMNMVTILAGKHIKVEIDGSALLHVIGDLTMSHSRGDNIDIRLNYNNGTDAKLLIEGDLYMNIEDGAKDVYVTAYEAQDTIHIMGNVIFENNHSSSGEDMFITMNAGNLIIEGNLEFAGARSDNMELILNGNSTMHLAGHYYRQDAPSKFGKITMNGTSRLILNGTEQQLFDGTTGNTDHNLFRHITVNNTAPTSPQILLTGDVSITNKLVLTDGNIGTGSNMLIVQSIADTAITGYSANSYVVGVLRRYIEKNTLSYTFPLGYNGTGQYYYATVKNNNLENVDYLTATFREIPSDERGLSLAIFEEDLVVTDLHPKGMWTIDPDRQPNKGAYTIEVGIENFNGLTDNNFRIIKRPTNSGKNGWGNGNVPFGQIKQEDKALGNGKTRLEGLTSFSDFGVGGGGGLGLPIDLVSFTLKPENEIVRFDWKVSMEINNEKFLVERSLDGLSFEPVAIIPGGGSHSNETKYYAYDESPVLGLAYYRLKQVDFDGQYRTYDMVSHISTSQTTNTVAELDISPNPNNGKFNLSLKGVEAPQTITVFDLHGQLVYINQVAEGPITLEGNYELTELLPNGMYLVKIDYVGGSIVKQMIVQ